MQSTNNPFAEIGVILIALGLAALLQLTTQALQAQAQPAQLVQAPAPVGQVPLAELRLQPGQTVQMPFPANTTAIQPMPQAIMTTQNMPAVPKS